MIFKKLHKYTILKNFFANFPLTLCPNLTVYKGDSLQVDIVDVRFLELLYIIGN